MRGGGWGYSFLPTDTGKCSSVPYPPSQYGDFLNKPTDHDLWSRWYTAAMDLEENQIEAMILERNFAPLSLPWKDSRLIRTSSNLMIMLRSYEVAVVSCRSVVRRQRVVQQRSLTRNVLCALLHLTSSASALPASTSLSSSSELEGTPTSCTLPYSACRIACPLPRLKKRQRC